MTALAWPRRFARPVIHAVIEVLNAVLIAAGVIVSVGAAGLVGLLTRRWQRTRLAAARATSPLHGAAFPLRRGAGRSAAPAAAARDRAARRGPPAPARRDPADIAAVLARREDGQA